MKSLLKKLKSLFAIVLIFPVMFIFSACGKKDKNDGNTNPPSGGIEQPGGNDNPSGGGSGNGSGENPDSPTPSTPDNQSFSVAIDYNLPEYLADLKADETKSANVSTGYTLPTFVGTEYEDYFTGWEYDNGETVEDGIVYGVKDSTVSVKAVWNETRFKKLFYTDGLDFSYTTYDDKNYATVKSYIGTSEIVVIPQFVIHDGTVYDVSGIGESVFAENKSIKEVRTYLLDFSVANSAFENSTLEILEFEKVSSIGNSAFKGTKVKSVIFSDYLTSVSDYMFENCINLETVKFSASAGSVPTLKLLPKGSFRGCTKLSLVDLHTSTEEIGVEAFKDCSSIVDFSFIKNSSVTKILNSAFANCISLENIEIPVSVVSYGTQIFEGCLIKEIKIPTASLNSEKFSARFGNLSLTLNKIEFIGATPAVIPGNYLEGYSELVDVIMCNSITAMQEYVFYDCSKLDNIVFSTNICSDDFNLTALYGTKWIRELDSKLVNNSLVINNTLLYVDPAASAEYVVPENVKYIAKNIFSLRETNVTSVSIHENVEYISKDAFVGSKITSITVDEDNVNYGIVEHVLDIEKYGYSLCKLEDSKSIELIAYVSTVSGGVIVLDENVTIVNDSAFGIKNAPDMVYIAQRVNVIFSETQRVEYVFESGESTITNPPSGPVIYRILSDEYYEIDEDGITPIISNIKEVSELGQHHLIIVQFEEPDSEGGVIVIKFYYLITIDGDSYTLEEITLPGQFDED